MLLFYEMKIITTISFPDLKHLEESKQLVQFFNFMTNTIILYHNNSNKTLSTLCVIINSLDNSFLYYF